jgi:ubiquinone/menaquinone biosynthesis C-methylase UbiE
MTTEQTVAAHYRRGDIEQKILAALKAAGKDIERLTTADLAPVDEFHTGGRAATIAFAEIFAPRSGEHLLDIGCGIGGPARYFAETFGCKVSGIDLTDDYVRAAQALARRVKLDGAVDYRQGSALALPWPDATFDAAYLLHVGMNIADKAKLFAEVRRVLKPGGRFGLYDVMRRADGALTFPVPWASAKEQSFVETPDTYRRLLQAAGFAIEQERDRQAFALEFFRKQRALIANSGPPPLGTHIIIGPAARERFANYAAMTEQGLVGPAEMVARAN